jgi:folate-binding protein YgfZ
MIRMSANASNPTPPGSSAAGPLDGAVRLADWGVIRAAGADARSFLQGQLTQDLQGVQPGQARLAGYCSPKGRLLASFVVWSASADEFLLACSADLLAPTLKRLSMYVLRARCKLSDASADVPLRGVAGPAAAALPVWGQDHGLIRLPDGRLDGQPVPRALAIGAAPVAGTLDAATWAGLEASSGVVRIVAATTEQFVPQMVNLELVGGVSFAKGCYPGQEVVARSQYRGTLKRRAYVLSSGHPVQPGQEVYTGTDAAQPAGLVALAGPLAGQHVVLAELKIAAVEDGAPLTLGAPNGPPLALGELPYAIPLAAEGA